jgi:ABC-type lipoprotein release transport system permease subunit
MAMGATRGAIARTVVSGGLRLAGLGILVGVTAAPAGLKALSALLFGVSSADPVSLAFAPVLLGAAAVIASGIPAWRASRSEAIAALREQ